MKRGSAVVEVTVEIRLPDKWGSDCQIAQLFSQAEEGARQKVIRMIGIDPNVSIRGKPKVTAVLIEEE